MNTRSQAPNWLFGESIEELLNLASGFVAGATQRLTDKASVKIKQLTL